MLFAIPPVPSLTLTAKARLDCAVCCCCMSSAQLITCLISASLYSIAVLVSIWDIGAQVRSMQAEMRNVSHTFSASHRTCKLSKACSIARASVVHGKPCLPELRTATTVAILNQSSYWRWCCSLRSGRSQKRDL